MNFFSFLIDQSTAVTEPYKHNNAGTRVSISIQQSSAAHRFSCPEKLLTTDEIPTNWPIEHNEIQLLNTTYRLRELYLCVFIKR